MNSRERNLLDRHITGNYGEDQFKKSRMEVVMYVYIQSEPGLWTVGFYDPSGKWHAESDHESQEAAGNRVHYLNGGRDKQ